MGKLIFSFCLVAWTALVLYMRGSEASLTVNTPGTVKTLAGETTRLQCSFRTSPTGTRVVWEKDEYKIANVSDCTSTDVTTCETSLVDSEKYGIEGSLTSGISLLIQQISLDDDGIYLCKVISSNGIGKGTVRLTVTNPPSSLDIIDVSKGISASNRIVYAVAHREHRLNCIVTSPSNPPANITWSVADVANSLEDQTDRSSATHVSLMTSSRVIILRPTIDDGNKNITCIAQHYGLATPLQATTSLRVGSLPEKPSNVDVVESSITTNSLVVTWQPGSSRGELQKYTVIYCYENCLNTTGIRQTRLKIGDLRSHTIYRITVMSYTMFGYSDVSDSLATPTKPLSPNELGIKAVYNSRDHSVEVSRSDNSTGSLPVDVCFQMVYAANADPVSSDCVLIGNTLPVPNGVSSTDMNIVSCGNNVCSEPSIVLQDNSGTGSSVAIIAGAVGAVCVVAIIIIGVCIVKKKGGSYSHGIREQQGNRGLPARPRQTQAVENRRDDSNTNPRIYSGVKYQEVTDPPGYDTQMMQSQDNMLYTVHPHRSALESKQQEHASAGAPGQYYSRRIKPNGSEQGLANKAGHYADKYAYIDPNE